MAIITPATICIFLAIGTLYVIKWRLQGKHARPLPPGPKGIPLLGNVNDMPKPGMLECHHWLQHKDLYGPISSVTVLGQTFVIINDPEIAFELLRDRSAIHSSRPGQVFSGEMVGWRHATAMSPYSETWKIHRKNITKIASTNVSISVFDRVQEVESVHFLLNLLDSPDKLFDHIRKEAGSVILKITYGYTTVAHGNDPLVDLAGKTMEQFAEATVPGKWMVDLLPFLRYLPDWFPGTAFKGTARQMKIQLKKCVEQPYQFVKQQMREKKHPNSFLSQCIDDIGTDPEMEFVHKWAALALYLGGADTTVSSTMTFFLAISIFPEVQKKAQEELDRVIGNSRLPVSADRESLPYIEAVMKETHRWHLVLPMGLPHSSVEEDICRGYRIPKGAILLPNNWHFTHDPTVYPEPMTFRPERYLETSTHKPEPDPRKFIFGYGRRICPGRYVADNALFITIAQSLAVFNVNKSVENGKTIEPEVKFEPGAISHPKPYRCSITPRSKAHEELIRASEQDYPFEESNAKELENSKW
ncbi:O-methylsterigmatocystin oxidoreductase [Cucurbitaria berberidis CBS 394.84]|uniref:O-methylsterigmatocystin oxidoreductase n=1 Tax=Cucurbitaria berberidis CBS 394.84 TaxID=1168544 RepID=A0A9P4GMF2_9PLEO|nr:O-methylsterigmatocystin oxidoreductase [Cucurbitaria berberidis CBS 394.84]KAF1849093.1 O-methylsterigmatocystin oxidoreductase [Cucurbitaria berberidis CBS 394.84]